jgi:catechol 2,3-dioxygenase-like lactoylglutathione lyase family enzyme
MFESTKAYSSFAVDDLEKAREFYGETLGLPTSDFPPGADTPFGLMVTLAGGRDTLIYPKEDFEPATYTMLNFEVPDVETAVEELNSRGLEMERYEGFDQDEKGIARMEGFPPGAWFEDPAGNVILAHEPMSA